MADFSVSQEGLYLIMIMKEWKQYKVGKKSTKKNWTEPSCQPFEKVRHITHINDAIRIVEDGAIRSSLVWDESKLNNSRACVSWVSPNSWSSGSIYGNISFEYLWDALIKKKNFYWVEDVKKYNPPAYRILITDSDYSNSNLVSPYHFEDGEGPIYFDGQDWYRNGHYTGEILLDQDLSVDSCYEIRFEHHNKKICSRFGSGCKDIRLADYEAGARFMANVIGRNIQYIRDLFLEKNNKKQKLSYYVRDAIGYIYRLLAKKSSNKISKLNSTKRYHLTRACFCALSENNTDFLDSIVPMLGTDVDLLLAMKEVVDKYFDSDFQNIENW